MEDVITLKLQFSRFLKIVDVIDKGELTLLALFDHSADFVFNILIIIAYFLPTP